MRLRLFVITVFALCLTWLVYHEATAQAQNSYREWRHFGGGSENIHYTTLDQITKTNVNKLQVAWTYDTGDVFTGSEIQCNPLIIDGVLYATTPKLKLIALDAATGQLKWSFDPNTENRPFGKMRNRGLMYWADGNDKRVFFGYRQYLYAVDATTGKAVSRFGENGKIDLREGLGREPSGLSLANTTPGAIFKDLLILGPA